MKKTIFALLTLTLLFLAGCGENTLVEEINTYEDCVAAGYPSMESYPMQCMTDDGRIFTYKPDLTDEDTYQCSDEQKQAEMTNKELHDLVRTELSKLCKTGGKSLTMCVPPMVTDTDMLISELLNRFKQLTNCG